MDGSLWKLEKEKQKYRIRRICPFLSFCVGAGKKRGNKSEMYLIHNSKLGDVKEFFPTRSVGASAYRGAAPAGGDDGIL